MAALLPHLKEIRVSGEATVQQIFDIKLKGKETLRIAGSRVSNGVVEMKEGVRARVLRGAGREVVHEGMSLTCFFGWLSDLLMQRVQGRTEMGVGSVIGTREARARTERARDERGEQRPREPGAARQGDPRTRQIMSGLTC